MNTATIDMPQVESLAAEVEAQKAVVQQVRAGAGDPADVAVQVRQAKEHLDVLEYRLTRARIEEKERALEVKESELSEARANLRELTEAFAEAGRQAEAYLNDNYTAATARFYRHPNTGAPTQPDPNAATRFTNRELALQSEAEAAADNVNRLERESAELGAEIGQHAARMLEL